jgi:F420-dependent oxidoreductase-like protein
MKLGVHVVNFAYPGGPAAIGPKLARLGRAAEAAGVANLSAMDHYLQISGAGIGGVDAPMLEGYTTLGYLAAHTSTVQLQLLVTGVTYRHPGLLGKIVSTLDVLSGGRAVLGLGAAWYEREHAAYGVPFPPLRERFERLEETLQIVHQMWSDNDGPFEGRHYRLAETINLPQPLTRPHPPIMIGGTGEKKTLPLVARYADATNMFAGPQSGPAQTKVKLAVLAEHCAREGTDFDRIRKTVLWTGRLATDAEGGKGLRRAAVRVRRDWRRGGARDAVRRRPGGVHREPRRARRTTPGSAAMSMRARRSSPGWGTSPGSWHRGTSPLGWCRPGFPRAGEA